MSTLQEHIGQRVKHLRMERHYSGKEFAQKIGWQPDYLSRFEKGKWRTIEPEKLLAVMHALDVTFEELTRGGQHVSPYSPTRARRRAAYEGTP
jgi:transcriptional regulator with XRE-family HTH domain